jgi:hypothetical protein
MDLRARARTRSIAARSSPPHWSRPASVLTFGHDEQGAALAALLLHPVSNISASCLALCVRSRQKRACRMISRTSPSATGSNLATRAGVPTSGKWCKGLDSGAPSPRPPRRRIYGRYRGRARRAPSRARRLRCHEATTGDRRCCFRARSRTLAQCLPWALS